LEGRPRPQAESLKKSLTIEFWLEKFRVDPLGYKEKKHDKRITIYSKLDAKRQDVNFNVHSKANG